MAPARLTAEVPELRELAMKRPPSRGLVYQTGTEVVPSSTPV